MAQKVQFIVTVLHEPKLLIFDEPFSGFDPINANIIKDEILELKRKGTSIIFSTHRMASVEELCEYIALIHQSEKILDGRLTDIKKIYKENIFEVGMQAKNGIEIITDLKQHFMISDEMFDATENQLNFNLQLSSKSTQEILTHLATKAPINHFLEKIPTVNDIFIKTIESKKSNE